MIFTVFLLMVLHAAGAPLALVPTGGAVTYSLHPHFKWQREADVKLDETHAIQIARDETFAEVVCDDRLEVVSRFVPVKPLPPAKYWWRVRRGEGGWSQANTFASATPPTQGAWIITDEVKNIHTAANHFPAEVPEMKSTETK